MKKNLSYLFVIISIQCFAQQTYDIYFPQTDRQSKCDYFFKCFRQKPKEVKFGIKKEADNLYFEINDKRWFDLLFKSTGDGISVDVVSKKRYSCNVVVKNTQIRGTLLAPVYAMQLKKKIKKTSQDTYRVLVGKIPDSLKNEELEFNILFLHNRALCQYYNIYNLESYGWDLLDMGVYLDSLTYKNKKITSVKEKVVTKYKTLKFSVPFEKNKSEYKPADIKPMYDSLSLTNYTIKKIDIKAYASVEGSLKRNITLQKQRANSIASSLQTFQKPSIETIVSSSENWVEFFNDISTDSNFLNLADLSKDEIKTKLVGDYAKKLESVLKKHRKAVVILSLEKKDKYKELKVNELVTHFNKAIETDNIEEANNLQNSILKKLQSKGSFAELAEMRIPNQKKYINLLEKNSIIKYVINFTQTLIVEHELKKLQELDSGNKKIAYNLVVLNFFIWKNRAKKIDRNSFKKEILNLKKVGISNIHIEKMLVNFHILKAQEDLRSRNYDEKDTSIEFITDTYEGLILSDYDYLSLAQYLTYYSNVTEAIDLLENKVKEITIDEDLLFYYLNLTITNSSLAGTNNYKTMLLNAINMNKERFCRVFNSTLNGGVTFQLLENIDLRVNYCDNCSKKTHE